MGRKLWSDEKLLYRLITNKSEGAYWSNIVELRKRGSSVLFEKCIFLTKSNIQKERRIGIDVLSQLSTATTIKPFSKKVFTHFLDLLQKEKDPDLVTSILYGIGHNNENLILDEDIKLIIGYKTNEQRSIREGVVFALLGIDHKIAIDALIDFSRDRYCDIRNWATFGLGSQIERNTTKIRDALWERIDDKHEETRNEAIVGLAKRKDLRVTDIIKQELTSNSCSSLLFEAIEELQDITFLPYLDDLRTKSKDEPDLNRRWFAELEQCINNLKT